jgi:oligopeptide/dipeptide ABC transporter ATP-binding protein
MVEQGDGRRPLLEVRDLTLSFPSTGDPIRVLHRVSFSVYANEVVGLVGESGSGKTTTGLAAMRLARPPARIEAGQVLLDGEDLLTKSEHEIEQIRGARMSMIFQTPRTALNPLLPVGEQVARVYRLHRGLNRRQAQAAAVEMLGTVGIADAARRARSYPHQLSGGMCQRVMIAMMVACDPELLIADEPTTGLDVTIQAQIFDLLKKVRQERGLSILLISHDLGVIAETCDRVVVMHAGHVVEVGSVRTIFHSAQHPYTRRLLGATLGAVAAAQVARTDEQLDFSLSACRFANKCPQVMDVCRAERPLLRTTGAAHQVACHLYVGGVP